VGARHWGRAGEGIVSEQPPWNPYDQPQDPNQYQGQPPYQGQPYQGQPYRQGQPYQGPPPYGPPGNPPPYPGPGYSHPPQPHRKQPRGSSHWIRNILSGIGAVVVASVVISHLSSGGSGVTATPSGNTAATASPAATRSAAPAGIGSYFDVQDGSGDTYRVILVKVIDPAQGADQFTTPDSGKRFVAAVFRIKALKGSPQDEDANNDAVIVGSDQQTYSADFDDIAGYTNFAEGTIQVAQGDTVTGAVTFQVPDGVKVSEVQWGADSDFGSAVQWDVRR